MIRSATALLFCALLHFTALAQFKVFDSYEDWKKGKGRSYEKMRGVGVSMGKPTVKFMAAGNDKVVTEKGIWGFTRNDTLFRIELDHQLEVLRMVRTRIEGAVCLWQTPAADLIGTPATDPSDWYFLVSLGMGGELVAIPHGISQWSGTGIGEYKRFLKDNKDTQYRSLCECLEKDRSTQGAEACVKSYNEMYPAKH